MMFLSKMFLEIETDAFEIDDGLGIGIGIFSIILFALSITAYRNTGMKKILFASAAFGLFAVQLLVDSFENYFGIYEDLADISVPLITLVILILFFVAIVKKR